MTELTRDQQLLEEFKAGLDKDGPIVLAQRIAALEKEKAALIAAQAGHDDELEAERERADTAEKDRDAAIARAEKAEGGEKRAKASLTKATTPAKPRKLGAMDNALVSDRSNVSDADQMKLAIAEADEVQIAFSDGTREVPGLQPVNVAGDAWRQHQFGLMLTETVELAGPDGGSSVTIDGYALLLDGKQVAYCRRSAPLQVGPGQRVNIVDDIIF